MMYTASVSTMGLSQGLEEDKTIGGLGFKKTKLIADGAVEFTCGMGMRTLWDKERAGPVPFEVSDADTMMHYLKSAKKNRL